VSLSGGEVNATRSRAPDSGDSIRRAATLLVYHDDLSR